ncbi:cell envelope integrity protein TolA [Legionella feeleii]|uniref:TolA colicin import membrane protein n=1 Tax=Legionella feeleii TaxID=453 RepID=A0A0W0TIK3_9GAMM|nr:cell envelope integrity protein TolA [Legionella feeleii]KTC95411.1 TolA colicin import membrane protein [Legionella feeleii]SPX59992.1 TolA colicin import membrane protein [Legionella feeleii]
MINDQTYRKAFFIAIALHFCLALLLTMESTNQRPVMTLAAKNEPSKVLPVELAEQPKEQAVKAVSVDNQEVMKTVNRLKQERANQLRAEQSRQQALVKQAEMARKARLQEQQRLAKLKEEAERVAIARKKQIEEEKRRLKQLALQKEQEAKRLEELKHKQELLQKKQQQEAEKLAQLKKKQAEEKIKSDKIKAEKAKEELARAEKAKAELAEKAKAELAEKQRQAAMQQAAQDAAKKAHIAGEVDKYKAMIVNAISRQWILPENVNSGLSSQFRIRLAPDGAVLDVSLTRGSGDPVLDRSAETAIRKASPLPVPTDPDTFNMFRDISLTVRPENVRG